MQKAVYEAISRKTNPAASDGAGDPFTKEEVTAEGYLWRDEEIKVDIPEGSEVVYTSKDGNIEI